MFRCRGGLHARPGFLWRPPAQSGAKGQAGMFRCRGGLQLALLAPLAPPAPSAAEGSLPKGARSRDAASSSRRGCGTSRILPATRQMPAARIVRRVSRVLEFRCNGTRYAGDTRLRNGESQNQSPKFLEVRNSLPEDLRSIYERMIDEYRFQALELYGHE